MHGSSFHARIEYIFGEYIFDEYYIKWNIRNGRRRSVHISVDFYVPSFFFLFIRLRWRARTFSVPRNWIYCNRFVVAMVERNWMGRWCARIVLLPSDNGVRSLLLYLRVKCSSNCASNQFSRCLFILLICFVFAFFRFDFSVFSRMKMLHFLALLLTQPK